MKDLQLVGGDLLPAGRGFSTVAGSDYLRQRVACALSEPYGSDPYHPTWGSVLQTYLGSPIGSQTSSQVSAEVSRVLAGLIAAQQQLLTSSALTTTKSQYAADDVIASVDSINVAPGANPTALQVSLSITTQAGQQVVLTRTVST